MSQPKSSTNTSTRMAGAAPRMAEAAPRMAGAAPRIAVLGGGSWATALVKILLDNRVDVRWWMRNQETVQFIRKYHHNPRYLPAATVRMKSSAISTDLIACLKGASHVVIAVPSAFLKAALSPLAREAFHDKIVISAVKGMIPDENLLIGQYLLRHFDLPEDRFLLIGGPCHAEEVAQEKLSYLTISGRDPVRAELLASALRNRYIHASVSEDTEGTEYAAIMKNIYAVAGGIAHGLGYGDNFMAVLVSNAIIELKQFLRSIYPVRRDIKGSAYLGDLLVTAYSQYSRNRTFGTMLGKGYSVRSAQLEMNMVAEGYYAARCIHEINRIKRCSLPIAETVYRVLYEGNPPRDEFQKLSHRLH